MQTQECQPLIDRAACLFPAETIEWQQLIRMRCCSLRGSTCDTPRHLMHLQPSLNPALFRQEGAAANTMKALHSFERLARRRSSRVLAVQGSLEVGQWASHETGVLMNV